MILQTLIVSKIYNMNVSNTTIPNKLLKFFFIFKFICLAWCTFKSSNESSIPWNNNGIYFIRIIYVLNIFKGIINLHYKIDLHKLYFKRTSTTTLISSNILKRIIGWIVGGFDFGYLVVLSSGMGWCKSNTCQTWKSA